MNLRLKRTLVMLYEICQDMVGSAAKIAHANYRKLNANVNINVDFYSEDDMNIFTVEPFKLN